MSKREFIERKRAIDVIIDKGVMWKDILNLLNTSTEIPIYTEYEILEPYLEMLKAMISEIDLNKAAKDYEDRFYGFQKEILQMIDSIALKAKEGE